MNVVVMRGRLSRPVEERELPSGDRLSVFDLTVPAAEEGGRASSAPLAWFGSPSWMAELEVGEELVVLGTVRRRFFQTGGPVQSRTEVVVEAAAPARRPARVGDLLERARRQLEAAPDGEPRRSRRRAPATFP